MRRSNIAKKPYRPSVRPSPSGRGRPRRCRPVLAGVGRCRPVSAGVGRYPPSSYVTQRSDQSSKDSYHKLTVLGELALCDFSSLHPTHRVGKEPKASRRLLACTAGDWALLSLRGAHGDSSCTHCSLPARLHRKHWALKALVLRHPCTTQNAAHFLCTNSRHYVCRTPPRIKDIAHDFFARTPCKSASGCELPSASAVGMLGGRRSVYRLLISCVWLMTGRRS